MQSLKQLIDRSPRLFKLLLVVVGWLASVVIGLYALLVVAADEETGVGGGLLVDVCIVVFKLLYFPLVYVESSSNVAFVVLYILNVSIWYLLLLVSYRWIRWNRLG